MFQFLKSRFLVHVTVLFFLCVSKVFGSKGESRNQRELGFLEISPDTFMCTKIKLPKMRGRIDLHGTCLSHLVGFVAIPLGLVFSNFCLLFPKAVTSMLTKAPRMPKTLATVRREIVQMFFQGGVCFLSCLDPCFGENDPIGFTNLSDGGASTTRFE